MLRFERLLELLDLAKGRFIPLGRNRFLALSARFKKHLQELKAISEEPEGIDPQDKNSSSTGKHYRLHTFGSLVLKPFVDEVSHIEGNQAWQEKLKALKKAESHRPKLPKTLQATLREYQREGFEWGSRLASLGMGMCLADDMGLGKTLQTKDPDRQNLVWSLKAMDVLVCSYTLLQQEEKLLEENPGK